MSLKATAANFTANNEGKDFALIGESCLPANGYFDPGETNTVVFGIKNTSGAEQKNVKVTILEQTGVTFASGEVTVGTVAKDAVFTVTFTFRSSGACGSSLTPTLHVTSDAGAQDITFISFQLGATVKTPYPGSNGAAITVNDFNTDSAKLGRATPYPSTINISGVPKADTGETVDRVSVTLNNVTHTWSQDLQVLLVGPNGKSVVLMANAGGASDITAAINNVTLTFDDTAANQLPPAGQIVSGTFKSSNFGAGSFPDVGGANSGSLAAFNGMADPNGAWKLYVIDDSTLNQGAVAGGWSLSIQTTKVVCCGAGQLFPFVSRIGEATVAEDLNGGENVQIAAPTVSDLDDSDASKLSVTAISLDQSKVTDANLIVEGSGNNRTVKVKKLVANAFGNVQINVLVTDPQGHTSVSSFNLKINAINDPPTISKVLGQKLTQGSSTGPLSFTLGDVETLPENILVLATSSNADAVPPENIIISGSGANRTVNVLPRLPTTSGSAVVTLTARDAGDGVNGSAETPMSFVVDFGATAGNPTITPLNGTTVSVDEDGSVVVPFQVRSGNPNVSADSLVVTRSSANTTLLPLNNVVLGGSGIDRTVTLTPAANANGSVSVTLTVANGGLTDTTTFTLTINPKNDAPTITSVAPQTTNEDTTSGEIVFTVGDVETAAANLSFVLTSPDSNLVPLSIVNPADLATAGGYSVSVNGGVRTVRIRPVPNQFGKATITATVTDGGDNGDAAKSTTTSFVLTVNAVNDVPGITAVGNDNANLKSFPSNGDPAGDVDIFEDSGSTADDTKGQRTIVLNGIFPGPSNEASQSTTIVATSNKPDFVSIVKIDPATVSGATANTTLTVKLGENKWTPADGKVEITLVLTDNGGTDLGGNNTTTRKFIINLKPVNDTPSLTFPTLPAPIAPATLSEYNVPKNRSFTLPMSLSDVETAKTLINMSASVAGDTAGKFPDGAILFDPGRTVVTFIPNNNAVTLPYSVDVTVTATDLGATNTEGPGSSTETRPISVTKTFRVTIRDIEPPTITSSSTDIQIDEDNVATGTLTLADNHPLNNLTFTVKSDNPALVPNDGIILGSLSGGGALTGSRTFAIVPAADQNGVANITITAKDDETIESSVTIKLTVRAVSDRPTLTLRGIITPIPVVGGGSQNASITILEDKATKDDSTDSKLLEFDMSDAINETPVNLLQITKASSNTDLVPNDNIVISGTGTRRTLTVTPAANKNGAATITITITDESGLSAAGQFVLNVTPVNDAPTINGLPNLALDENAPERTVNLSGITIGPDPGTGPAQTLVSVVATAKDKRSDDVVVNNIIDITPGTIVVDGNGNSSFKFRPKSFANGTSIITVTVSDSGGTANDGKDTASTSFEVSVNNINQLPTISFQQAGAIDADTDVTIAAGASSGVVPFYVNDSPETAPENLVVTATSSNTNLIPNNNANLQLGGTFGTRSIVITPAAGQSGTAVVTLTVTDAQGGSKTAIINVTVTPGLNPTITLTPNTQQIGVNQFSDLIQINVGDGQTPPAQLKTGYQESGLISSDNPALVPASPSNIQFGGSDANRVAIILPTKDQTGTANITFTVKDGDGRTSSAVFKLVVLGSAPTISQATPSSVNVDPGKSSPAVSVTVSDKETFPGLLDVKGKSSDTTVIADNNIFVLGNSGNRSVTVLAGSKGGSATITLTVTDSEGQTATTSFVVNVADSNRAPTITSIGSQTTTQNKPTGLINFVVGDSETTAADLKVTASSANTTLVPNANISVLTSQSNPASRSLIITPANNQTGTSLITVTVTDGGNKTASTSFALTVTSTSVANDFNGDGTQDIILQDNAGFLAAWFMSGDSVASTGFLTPNNVGDIGWAAIGSGDFDGDGKPDILFQHTDGSLAVWKLNGTTLASSAFLIPGNSGSKDWKAVAVADFNKDGKPDILFQNTDSSLAIWYMDGVNLILVAPLKPGASGKGWVAVAAADINGDTNTDIVFQHTDGTLAVWYLIGGNNLLLSGLITPQNPGDVNFRVVGTIDLNGDGKADLLFQNRQDTSIAVWYMNREKLIVGKLLSPSSPGGTWRVVAP